jgi:transposase
MPMPEGKADAVIGVDTHRDSHAAAILDRDGGPVAELTVTSDQAGSEALLGLSPSGRGAAAGGRGGDRLLRRRAGQLPDRPGRVGDRDRPGPSGPGAATAPRATRWTPSGPAGRR